MDLGLKDKVAAVTGGSVNAIGVEADVSNTMGIDAFVAAITGELIPANIRVNTVNPGLVMTPDWQKTVRLLTEGTAQSWEAYLDTIAKDNAPIGRFASPEEVANLFVFLCSPRASYCVGSTYYIAGGWLRVTT